MKLFTALGTAAGAAAFVCALVGCAASPTQKNAPSLGDILSEATGQNGRACIRQHDIRGYGVLDQQILSVDGRRSHFLATVRPGCTSLNTSAGVLFSGNFYEICGQRADKVANATNQCSISQIYEFNSRDEALSVYNAAKEARQALKEARQDRN